MKQNNINVVIVSIVYIVCLTITSAREQINIDFQVCDVSMNKYFGDWNNSLISCVKHAITDLRWIDIPENDDYKDVRDFIQQCSSLVSAENIRQPSQFCEDEYQDDETHKRNCLGSLIHLFGEDNTEKQILISALFHHKQLKTVEVIEEDDESIHSRDTFVYEYLDDIASLITSSASMDKHFRIEDWNYSILSTVKHAITDMLLEDFTDQDARLFFLQLSNSVSADHIRKPKKFCEEKYQDNEGDVDDCNIMLEDAFPKYTTKQEILQQAILFHRQKPDENNSDNNDVNDEIYENDEDDENDENKENDIKYIQYETSKHKPDSYCYEYLDDVASRITNNGGENVYVMFRTPLHYCSYLHNILLYTHLNIT